MPTTLPLRLLQLITGLFLYGFGASLMIRAAIGVAPWHVLSQGIAAQTPLSFGLATNAIGALVLLLWWPLRQKPGVGTVLNVMLIGPSAQFGLWLLPPAVGLGWQLAMFCGGMLLVALVMLGSAWVFRWVVFMSVQGVPKYGAGLYLYSMPLGGDGLLGILGMFGLCLALLVAVVFVLERFPSFNPARAGH